MLESALSVFLPFLLTSLSACGPITALMAGSSQITYTLAHANTLPDRHRHLYPHLHPDPHDHTDADAPDPRN